MSEARTPSEEVFEVKQAITLRSREFEARFAARDAAGLVASYFVEDSDSPMASPPGGVPVVRGRADLIKMFQTQFDAVREIRLETLDVEADGSVAFEFGRAHIALTSGEKAYGRYTVLWREKGGEWRARIDFFASDGWPG